MFGLGGRCSLSLALSENILGASIAHVAAAGLEGRNCSFGAEGFTGAEVLCLEFGARSSLKGPTRCLSEAVCQTTPRTETLLKSAKSLPQPAPERRPKVAHCRRRATQRAASGRMALHRDRADARSRTPMLHLHLRSTVETSSLL